MGDDREALRKLCCEGPPGCVAFQGSCLACGEAAARILAAGWRPPPEPQGFFDSAGRITAAGLARIEGMPDIDVHGSPPEDEPPEPQAAASEVVEQAQAWLAWLDSGIAGNRPEQPELEELARALLAEHARAEAAERERDGWMTRAQELGRQQYAHPWTVNEAVQERMKREAAEAAVKRLTEALAKYGCHISPCPAESFYSRGVCSCGYSAALTPAGGGDGR